MTYIDVLTSMASQHGIEVLDHHGNRFAVQPGSSDARYEVRLVGFEPGVRSLWACSCPATTTCEHIRAVGEVLHSAVADVIRRVGPEALHSAVADVIRRR